jgi:UDP-glucose 4-epimerase
VKALVTGANGFIGRVLCTILKERGWIVAANDIKGPAEIPSWLDVDAGDWFHIGSYDHPRLYLGQNYDAIFHLGANSLLGPSVKEPLKYYRNNVGDMATMLDNVVNSGFKGAFIFASSAATYGEPMDSSRGLEEWEAGEAINPYGSTKVVGEMMLRESCAAYGLKAYAMRFFNVAGAYKNKGQDPDQPHILTKMTMASINNETFYINGKSYDTEDGTCVRDYIHVADVCDALITAAETLYNKVDGTYDAFNVCRGSGYSNLEVANAFKFNYPLEIDYKDSRPGDPAYLIGDAYKLSWLWPKGPQYNMGEIITSHYEYIKCKIKNQLT